MAVMTPRMGVEDRIKAEEIEESIALKSVRGDVAFFRRYLSDKQRLYAIKVVEFDGDWKRAAAAAGYSPKTTQKQIEEGPAMYAYMTSVKSAVSNRLMLSADIVLERLERIALQAEMAGDLGVSVRAYKLMGDYLQMFKREGTTFNFNNNGVIVTIANRPALGDASEPLDAVYRDILELNNFAALPAPVEEED
jgi:hypothetical protein